MTRRAIVVALAAALLVAAPVAARAREPAGACTDESGVVSVVDFAHWGGKVAVGCAPGAPATGLDVLHEAGFTTAGTQREGDAFVCRIDGKPTPHETACRDTPPPNAYWAYYYALPGDTTWSYSATGAASRHPVPGSAEAWAFGAQAKPGVSPREVLAGPATTTTTSSVPSTTSTVAPITTTSTAGVTTTSRAVTTSLQSSSTSAPTASTVTSSTVTPATVSAASESRTTEPGKSSGPAPLAATAAIVLLLAAGATIVARRRRTR